MRPIFRGLFAVTVAGAVIGGQQPQSRTSIEQKSLAEAIRSLPTPESRKVEDRLKNFKIDLDDVIAQQKVLSPGQDSRIQREVEDRLKPVPIVNNGLQPVLPQAAFSLYSALTPQEAVVLSERVRSVGRIETRTGSSVTLQGTGFVAPGSVIATNCHVVAAIGELTSQGWRLQGDTRIDFGDADQHPGSAEYRITGIASHPSLRGLDVAAMTVEGNSVDGSQPLPKPLPIASARFVQNGQPTLVGVVGYPELSKASDTIFRQLRDKTKSTKIYSPGAVLSVETLGGIDVLLHVANTMKGSSGSPVFSRDQFNVVAVHNCCTAGAPPPPTPVPCADVLVNRPFRNGAISAWSVAADSVMAPFFRGPSPQGK